MMPSPHSASLFCVGKFVRTAQSRADNLQIAVRGSTLRRSRAELSTAHFSETPLALRAFTPRKGIELYRTYPSQISERQLRPSIPEPTARSRLIDSQGTVVWKADCLTGGNKRPW
jgi:hypothetical protein